jgi:hypothetical protein
MRKVYVVDPNSVVSQLVQDAAALLGCTEVAVGIPPRLVREGVTGVFPFVYTEPDDPQASGLRLAALQLRNTFNTARTAAQINNSLDAITLILRRLAQSELDRT